MSTFDVSTYVGVWYQVAGYTAIFDAACKCITANYTLNDDGTVGVVNTCQSLDLPVSITGYAAAADAAYGDAGVFSVTLAGSDGLCPGPNYIVQEYVEGDYAIVQSPDFATLFILSRVQNVTTDKLDVSYKPIPYHTIPTQHKGETGSGSASPSPPPSSPRSSLSLPAFARAYETSFKRRVIPTD